MDRPVDNRAPTDHWTSLTRYIREVSPPEIGSMNCLRIELFKFVFRGDQLVPLGLISITCVRLGMPLNVRRNPPGTVAADAKVGRTSNSADWLFVEPRPLITTAE